MEKFKINDKIECVNGEDGGLTKGRTYKVTDFDSEDDPEIINDRGEKDYYYAHDFKLASRNGRPFKENLDRYMVYGTGCDNKSDLYMTETDMTKEAKGVAGDDDWTGDIIGYKLTPLFRVEVKATLKRLDKKLVKKKKTKK